MANSIPRPGFPQEGNILDLQRRIKELEAKERAHDDYLVALREVAEYAATIRRRLDEGQVAAEDRRYWIGWLAAIRWMEEAIVRRSLERTG